MFLDTQSISDQASPKTYLFDFSPLHVLLKELGSDGMMLMMIGDNDDDDGNRHQCGRGWDSDWTDGHDCAIRPHNINASMLL